MGIVVSRTDPTQVDLDSFKRSVSAKERLLVFQSWSQAAVSNQDIGAAFVLRILEVHPRFAKYFGLDSKDDPYNNERLNNHARVFGNFINTVVNNIGDDHIINYMHEVGAKHTVQLGTHIEEQMWEYFTEAMIDVVISKVPLKQQAKLQYVWRKIFRILTHHVKLGYLKALENANPLKTV